MCTFELIYCYSLSSANTCQESLRVFIHSLTLQVCLCATGMIFLKHNSVCPSPYPVRVTHSVVGNWDVLSRNAHKTNQLQCLTYNIASWGTKSHHILEKQTLLKGKTGFLNNKIFLLWIKSQGYWVNQKLLFLLDLQVRLGGGPCQPREATGGGVEMMVWFL